MMLVCMATVTWAGTVNLGTLVTFSFESNPAVAVFEIEQTTDSLKTVPRSITWYESGLSDGITIKVQDIHDSIYIGFGGFGTVWDITYGTFGQPGWGYAGIEDFAGTAGIESNTTWDELISRSPISLVGVVNPGKESFYFSYKDDMNIFQFHEINDVLHLSTQAIPLPASAWMAVPLLGVLGLVRKIRKARR